MSQISSPLIRLKQMVQDASIRSRVEEYRRSVYSNAETIRKLEGKLRASHHRISTEKPVRHQELEQVALEESELKSLIKQAVTIRSRMSDEELRTLDTEIERIRNDLSARRERAEQALRSIETEFVEIDQVMRNAIERYTENIRHLETIDPYAREEFEDVEQILDNLHRQSPRGRLRELLAEIKTSEPNFDELSRRQQYCQMKIWIGRYRKIQEEYSLIPADDHDPEDWEVMDNVFHRLVTMSKNYRPGYIEAFNRDFQTDWDEFIASAQDEFAEVNERIPMRGEF